MSSITLGTAVTPRVELFKAVLKVLKITEKIIRENTFEHKKKETGVKFNPRLSANRPLNNWSQEKIGKNSYAKFLGGGEGKQGAFWSM